MSSNKRRRAIKLIAILLGCIALMVGPTFGSVQIQKKGDKGNLFETAQKLAMPRNTLTYWFKVNSTLSESEEMHLNIHLAYSKTLLPKLSSMGVSINDTPLETKWIYDITKPEGGWWKIVIPTNLIKIGDTNQIKIESNHRSREGECQDIDNPDNWVVIFEDSNLELVKDKVSPVNLSQFYETYYEDFTKNNRLQTEFVLPSNPEVNDVETMLQLGCAVGNNYPGARKISYAITNLETMKQGYNKIFIGSYKNWDEKMLPLPDKNLKQGEGYLAIKEPTKEYPYYKTVVTGSDKEGSNKASKMLSQALLIRQIIAPFIQINSEIPLVNDSEIYHDDGLYTLKDFGYDTIKLVGAFHQKAGITLNQPRGLQSEEGAYIEVRFKHSDALIAEKSVLNVTINGISEGSVKLSHSNAKEGVLEVSIPKEALLRPVIKVDFEAYNYIGKIDCSKNYDDSAWTIIQDISPVYFKSSRNVLPVDLSNFPYINLAKEKNKAQLYCFAQPMASQNLEIMSLIATRLGQNTRQLVNFVCNAPTEESKKENLLYIGDFNTIDLPKEVKQQLAVIPEGNGRFSIKEGLAILPETLKDKSIIQVMVSPWCYDKRVYVIMYDKKENLKDLIEVISDSKRMWELKDQVACIGVNGVIQTFKIDREAVVMPLSPEEIAKTIEEGRHMPWWVFAIGAGIIIVLVFFIIKLIRNKKKKKPPTL